MNKSREFLDQVPSASNISKESTFHPNGSLYQEGPNIIDQIKIVNTDYRPETLASRIQRLEKDDIASEEKYCSSTLTPRITSPVTTS